MANHQNATPAARPTPPEPPPDIKLTPTETPVATAPTTISVNAAQMAVHELSKRGLVSVDDFDEDADALDEDGLPPGLPDTLGGARVKYGFKTHHWLASAQQSRFWTPISRSTPEFAAASLPWNEAGIFGNAEGCYCVIREDVFNKIREKELAGSRERHTRMSPKGEEQVIGQFGDGQIKQTVKTVVQSENKLESLMSGLGQ